LNPLTSLYLCINCILQIPSIFNFEQSDVRPIHKPGDRRETDQSSLSLFFRFFPMALICSRLFPQVAIQKRIFSKNHSNATSIRQPNSKQRAFDMYNDVYLAERLHTKPRLDLFDRKEIFVQCPGVVFDGRTIQFQVPRMLRARSFLTDAYAREEEEAEKVFTTSYHALSSFAFNKPSGNLTIEIEKVPQVDVRGTMYGLMIGLGPRGDFLTHYRPHYLEGVYLWHRIDEDADDDITGPLPYKIQFVSKRPKLPWEGINVKIRREEGLIRFLLNDKDYMIATQKPITKEDEPEEGSPDRELYPMIHTMDSGYVLRYLDPLDEK
jgi:hypothetical protein